MLNRLQKMTCALLVAAVLLAAAAPAFASSKVTAYVTKKTYVYKQASASSAHTAVAANTKVYIVGSSGSFSKVKSTSGSSTGYIKSNCLTTNKTSSGASWKSKVVKMNWFNGGSKVLKKGGYGYIYDISTGISLRIKRMGGHNHADVEPATASDTAKLLRIAGGKFSWKSHAVILRVGSKYVACGINTLPHGDQTIRNNNYNGQFCLHMVGSKTHGSDKVNSEHQKSIQKAYNWAH